MNAPLQLLQGLSHNRSADSQPRRSESAPAKSAQSSRNNDTQATRKESFSDALRQATKEKNKSEGNRLGEGTDPGAGAGRAEKNHRDEDVKRDSGGGGGGDGGAATVNSGAQAQNQSAERGGGVDGSPATGQVRNEIAGDGTSAKNAGDSQSAVKGVNQQIGAFVRQLSATQVVNSEANAANVDGDGQAKYANADVNASTTANRANQTATIAHNSFTAANSANDVASQAADSSATAAKQTSAVELKPVNVAQTQVALDEAATKSKQSSTTVAQTATGDVKSAQAQTNATNPALQNTIQQTSSTPDASETIRTNAAQQSNAAETSQQSSTQQNRPVDELRRQVLRHVETADVDDKPSHITTASQRRAGQVNSRVALEQIASTNHAPADSLTAQNVNVGATSAKLAPQIETFNVRLAGDGNANSTQSQQPVDESRFTGNVARGLSALVNQRGGVMHMRLDPPDLGQLRIQMTIARGAISAQFQAADVRAGQLLEQNISSLRTALERHGMAVDRLTVHVHQTGQSQSSTNQNMGDHNARDDQQQNNNQHDAADGRSRGRNDHQQDGRNERQRFAQHFESKPINFAQSFDAQFKQDARP